MSLWRLAYYSAVLGGWSAFFGWLFAEFLVLRSATTASDWRVALTCGVVGAAVGAGLSMAAGLTSGWGTHLLLRLLPGLVIGGLGGAVGGWIGNLLYANDIPRALGFAVLGVGVGVVEGLYDRSIPKLRNGVVGGLGGGLIGGLLFDPLAQLLASESGMTSRAVAFVVLGLCIGLLIGLAQVVFKEAWLTVVDGYKPGRQFILSQRVAFLGRGETTVLPLLGPNNMAVASQQAQITRRTSGGFSIENLGAEVPTMLRRVGESQFRSVVQAEPLRSGDVIKLGPNLLSFRERRGERGATASANATPFTTQTAEAKPPPPPPSKIGIGSRPAAAPSVPLTTAPVPPPRSAPNRGPAPPPPPPGKRS